MTLVQMAKARSQIIPLSPKDARGKTAGQD